MSVFNRGDKVTAKIDCARVSMTVYVVEQRATTTLCVYKRDDAAVTVELATEWLTPIVPATGGLPDMSIRTLR